MTQSLRVSHPALSHAQKHPVRHPGKDDGPMNGKSKKFLAAAGVTLAVAAGAAGAIAAGGNGRPGRADHPGPAVIASYLGLTPAQLREQLKAGKTLAQIAVAQGKTVAGLEDRIKQAVQSHRDP